MNCLNEIQKDQGTDKITEEFNKYYEKWMEKKQELYSEKFLDKLKICHVVLQEYSKKNKERTKK